MTLDKRKYKLIELITGIDDEAMIAKLEILLQSSDIGDLALLKLIKPMKKKTDLDQIAKEQEYTPPTDNEINEIIDLVNFNEPLEELLNQIQ